MRKKIVENRASYTLKDLEPMIEDFENYLKEEIIGDLRAKAQEVDDSIKELKDRLERNLKKDMEFIERQYETAYNEEHILVLEEDLKLLKELISGIEN